MSPCKHLNYDLGKYGGADLVTEKEDPRLAGFSCPVRYWRRHGVWVDNGPGQPRNAQNVQFCGRGRGRINGIFDCYNPGEMSCYELEGGAK